MMNNIQLNNLNVLHSLKEINKNVMNECLEKIYVVSNSLENKVNFLNNNHNSMIKKFKTFMMNLLN